METETVKSTKTKIAPKLRFKQFQDDWITKRLGQISEKITYGMNAASIPFDGIHKYLRITDIDEESNSFKPNPLTSPDGLIETKFELKQKDIVFARTGASTGKSYLYNPEDGKLYFAGFLIKFHITKAHPYFVFLCTLRNPYNKWVKIHSMRSGQPGLNAEEYKSWKLKTPSLPEQQKIASFLSSVDKKIGRLSRKKELLETYKKGVMQQLFSQEIRFKDKNGEEFPEWERKKLGELIKTLKSGKSKNDDDGNFNLYGSTGIIGKCKEISNAGEYILIARVGANAGQINFVSGKFGVTDNTLILDLLNDLNKRFIYYFLLNFNLNKLIFGSGQPLITGGLLKKLKTSVPQKKEQQKIADFLSAVDDKIEAVMQQIAKTQSFKKGLLQQMFV